MYKSFIGWFSSYRGYFILDGLTKKSKKLVDILFNILVGCIIIKTNINSNYLKGYFKFVS